MFLPLVGAATAFVPHALPGTAPSAVGRPRAVGEVNMIFGMFDKKPTEAASSSSGKRLNLKDISKAPAAPVSLRFTRTWQLPCCSFTGNSSRVDRSLPLGGHPFSRTLATWPARSWKTQI